MWNPQFVCDCPAVLKVVVTAVGVGLLTGFFGVGGGFAVVPALVMALRFTMPVAIGTSLFVIALNSATALASRLGGGVALDWRVVGIFTFAAVAASLLGSRVTSRLPAATLQRAFGPTGRSTGPNSAKPGGQTRPAHEGQLGTRPEAA